MPFIAVGLEHKTSPLSIRERAALEGEALDRAVGELARHPAVDEVAILSTCNRTEVYLSADDPAAAAEAAAAYITLDSDLAPYIQTWEEMAAAEHLFRVSSGLESQVLGEPQVLAQVRDALETTQRLGTAGPNLSSLFRAAISCARQARAGTALGRINVSIGSEAIRAAATALGSLAGRSALLVGGGEIGRLVAEELRHEKVGKLFIANRTESVATELAAQFKATPARLADVPRLLRVVDVVISCTSARHYVLTPEDLSSELLTQRVQPLQIFDLAIPRDVDPAVASTPGVALHDLDSLLSVGLEERWDEDVRAMEAVIAAEVQEFTAWYLTRRVAPVIASLRRHVEAVSEQELQRVAPRLAGLTDREREAVESLTNRLIDKMFHHLVLRLRLAAQTDPKLVEAAEFFFLHGEGGLFEHAADKKQSSQETPSQETKTQT
jgi:glutamyl-tRNA reductase